MPIYKYVAKSNDGRTVSGMLGAADRSALVAQLREKNLIIVSVNETKGGGKKTKLFSSNSVSTDDLVIFSRQLATMVDSGIPIVSALDILGEQIENDMPDLGGGDDFGF